MQIVRAHQRLELERTAQEEALGEILLEENARLEIVYRIDKVEDWQETCMIRLMGVGAKVRIRGMMHGVNQAKLAYWLTVEHAADKTESDIEFRGVAEDQSHLVFDGLIKVEPQVKGIVANEQNRNLLLSNQAVVESRPRLEIDSDEVVCRHGSTVGDLDEEQLFYLMSRGVPKEEARTILIEAFLGFIT